MYKYEETIKFYHTDAAGGLFFANLFLIAHDCYEKLLYKMGLKISDILDRKEYLIPIVHAEADYRIPIKVGEIIEVILNAELTGNSSFTLNFTFNKKNGKVAAQVKTVHAVVDFNSKKGMPIPENIKKILQNL
ncbi:MAG: acyl-CoA thioesterase [Actinobacteria bacterium]|nr:acyl-CoA thioesterase [Actinomycetota bacterium]